MMGWIMRESQGDPSCLHPFMMMQYQIIVTDCFDGKLSWPNTLLPALAIKNYQ